MWSRIEEDWSGMRIGVGDGTCLDLGSVEWRRMGL